MNALQALRSKVSYGVIALLWVNIAVLVARAVYGTDASIPIILGGGLIITLAATATWYFDRTGPVTRIVTSIAQFAQVSLLVYAFKNSPLQIDMHMYFFASLAVCAAWIDWRAIVAFTVATALHHLILYFVLPAAVFPGESEFTRVVLHAVVLLLQSGVLLMMSWSVERSLIAAESATRDAQAAQEALSEESAKSDELHAQSNEERSRREAEKEKAAEELNAAIGRIGAGLGRLAERDFSASIDDVFAGDLDQLRVDFNRAVDQLRSALNDISASAGNITSGSVEIRTATDDLSRRTEQQAVSLEETAAALGQITTTVQNAVERAV